MSFWVSRRVVVTGGGGFIGSHVVEALRQAGCRDVFIVRSKEHDLTVENQVVRVLQATRPDVLIHLAGLVGGIEANKARPAEFFFQNLMMGTLILHHAHRLGAAKFVAAGAGCGYPEHAPMPLQEESFWAGLPQQESAPYSLAKRLLHIQAIAYYRQHAFQTVIAIPGNVYGPHDNFDLETSHVVPALVRKFVDAAEKRTDEVVVWGSGRPTRDFVYAGDVARGILLAAERYTTPELVNVSSGRETSIQELVEMVTDIIGFEGRIVWDTSRPDGQSRRCFDVRKARTDLGFETQTTLRAGLEQTVAWYRANRELVRSRV